VALVGPVAAVRHQVDAELALGRLDRSVDLAGGHVMALAVELEMVDGRLHRALHLGAQRRDDLVVPDGNPPLTFGQPQLLQALFHDAHPLAHLLHSHEITVVAVPLLADWDVKIELGIALVGLCFAQIPGGAGAAHHDTGKAPTPGVCELDQAILTLRCLKMRFSVSNPSMSSQTLREGSQNAQMSSRSFGGKSWCTPPTRK